MTLKIEKRGGAGGWKDKQGESLAILVIPFRGSFKEAEGEIGKLECLACKTKVIFGHGNNVYTNSPEGRTGKHLKYTWRFVGARSHMAEFIEKILCH